MPKKKYGINIFQKIIIKTLKITFHLLILLIQVFIKIYSIENQFSVNFGLYSVFFNSKEYKEICRTRTNCIKFAPETILNLTDDPSKMTKYLVHRDSKNKKKHTSE